MPVSLILLALQAAAQPLPALPVPQQHLGRAFISPMGEPFHESASGEDGLLAWFRAADANHDNRLAPDELRKDAERFFATLDVNHDGEIDPDEIDRYETVVAPEVRISSGYDGGDADDEASGGGRLGLLTIPEPVTAADTSFDRAVSLAEFDIAANSRFQRLDTNRDGSLTLPELEALRHAVRANARGGHRSKPDDSQPAPDTGGDDSGGYDPGG